MPYDSSVLNLRSPRENISMTLRTALELIQKQFRVKQLPSPEEIDGALLSLNQYMRAVESEKRLHDYYSQSNEPMEYITFTFPECGSLLFGCAVNNAPYACYAVSGVLGTEDAASCRKLLDTLCGNAAISELKILTISHEEQMWWKSLCPKNDKISFYVLENADGNS